MKEEGNFSSPQKSPLPSSTPAAETTKKIGQTERVGFSGRMCIQLTWHMQ
jgi:hypothetical protein